MSNYQGPGCYRHFKGGLYDVLGLAPYEKEDGTVVSLVLYEPAVRDLHATISNQTHYTRHLASFNDMVQREHGEVRRFVKESDPPSVRDALVVDVCVALNRYLGPATANVMRDWTKPELASWIKATAEEIVDEVLS